MPGPADELLKHLILEREWLRIEELDAAACEQSEEGRRLGAEPFLGSLLVRRGKLQSEQLDELLDAGVRRALHEEEEQYSRNAADEGLSEEELGRALHDALQSKVPKRLAEFLLEKGTISREAHEAVRRRTTLVPKSFGKYQILDKLGEGGMGEVYRAIQPGLDRLVALKILPSEIQNDPEFVQRFNREAQAMARFSHPNIVAVYDFGVEDGKYYFVMEHVDGVNLRRLIETKSLDSAQALRILSQVCDALEYAHDEGVVHRDIKPENILIDRKQRAKVTDFGIARMVGPDAATSHLTRSQYVLGTPHYMAPEQIETPKSVDHRADIYAVGVVLYEMLTGELPLGQFDPPSKKANVDPRLDEVVQKALQKEPDRRYQRVSFLKSDVTRIVPDRTQLTPAPATPVHVPGRRTALFPVAAAVFLLALAVITLYSGLFRSDPTGTGDGGSPPRNGNRQNPPPIVDRGSSQERFEALMLGKGDLPAGWAVTQGSKRLSRNPLLAKEEKEIEEALRILTPYGLPAVSPSEVRQAYVIGFGRDAEPLCAVLDFHEERAARRTEEMTVQPPGAPRWIRREGTTIAGVFRGDQSDVGEQTYLFDGLVRGFQKKLGRSSPEGLEAFFLPEEFVPEGLSTGGIDRVLHSGEELRGLLKGWNVDGPVSENDAAYQWGWRHSYQEGNWARIDYFAARVESPETRSKLLQQWTRMGGRPVEKPPYAGAVTVQVQAGDKGESFVAKLHPILRQVKKLQRERFGTPEAASRPLRLEDVVPMEEELPEKCRYPDHPRLSPNPLLARQEPEIERLLREVAEELGVTLELRSGDLAGAWRGYIVPAESVFAVVEFRREEGVEETVARLQGILGNQATVAGRGKFLAFTRPVEAPSSNRSLYRGLAGLLQLKLMGP